MNFKEDNPVNNVEPPKDPTKAKDSDQMTPEDCLLYTSPSPRD